MRQQQVLTLVLGLLLIGFVSNAQAVTLNVTIQGTTVTPQGGVSDNGTGLATVSLSSCNSCNGGVFGPITVSQVDPNKGDARVEAQENNPNQAQDELRIVNAKFTRTGDPQGAPLTISLSATFGPIPDGNNVGFNMAAVGDFKRAGNYITTGGCSFNASGSITRINPDGSTLTTSINPLSYACPSRAAAAFNQTGNPVYIDIGTGLNRIHTQLITYVLSQNGDWMDLSSTVEHVGGGKKPKKPTFQRKDNKSGK